MISLHETRANLAGSLNQPGVLVKMTLSDVTLSLALPLNINSALASFNSVNNVPINALTAVGALRALIDFTLSNARRFYSSIGNPLAAKGLTA